MAHHEQYILKVTAGATYDTSKHEDVHVNTEKHVNISSEHIDARIHVRIKDYRGLPEGSPSTSPYFSTPQHPYDRYSISFAFTPKRSITGKDLVFGNDFEHPIRDRLPPLFDKAFGIVKWWIDPGLDGDVYGDNPYLYGALLSSINVLRIGNNPPHAPDAGEETEGKVVVYEEGAEGDGVEVRSKHSIPAATAQRQKHFLNETKRTDFTFEEGREYKCDFFNPYVDFNEFALKIGYGLPAISIIGHWDGQPLRTHSLRYVLKDRSTNTELFVVIFQLIPTEEAKKEIGIESAEDLVKKVHGGDRTEAKAAENDDELD
ncbi:F-box domain containing protein [Paraphaeosphaeria sporulosa]